MWNPHGHLIIFFNINLHFIFILSGINLLSFALSSHSFKMFFSKKVLLSLSIENPDISSLSHFPQEVKLQNILSESLEENQKNSMLQNKKRLCMCVTAVYSMSISLSLSDAHTYLDFSSSVVRQV